MRLTGRGCRLQRGRQQAVDVLEEEVQGERRTARSRRARRPSCGATCRLSSHAPMAMADTARPHRATCANAASSLNQPWAKASASSPLTAVGEPSAGASPAPLGVVELLGTVVAVESVGAVAGVLAAGSSPPTPSGPGRRAAWRPRRSRRRSVELDDRLLRRGVRGRDVEVGVDDRAGSSPCTSGRTSSASGGRPSGRSWPRRRTGPAATTSLPVTR